MAKKYVTPGICKS